MSLFRREITFEVTLVAYADGSDQEINKRIQDFIDGANVIEAEGEKIRQVRVGARPWLKLVMAGEPFPGQTRTATEEVFGTDPTP